MVWVPLSSQNLKWLYQVQIPENSKYLLQIQNWFASIGWTCSVKVSHDLSNTFCHSLTTSHTGGLTQIYFCLMLLHHRIEISKVSVFTILINILRHTQFLWVFSNITFHELFIKTYGGLVESWTILDFEKMLTKKLAFFVTFHSIFVYFSYRWY